MRKILVRAFGLLKSRKVDVPEDLSKAFGAVMQGERQVNKATVKKHLPKPRKAVVMKEVEKKEAKKAPFLLHMQNGKVYDLEKPLAEQDSDEEDEDEPPVVSRKRKGDEMEMLVAKRARAESELEDGEVDE